MPSAFTFEVGREDLHRYGGASPPKEVVRVLTGQPPLSPVNADDLVEARWSRSP